MSTIQIETLIIYYHDLDKTYYGFDVSDRNLTPFLNLSSSENWYRPKNGILPFNFKNTSEIQQKINLNTFIDEKNVYTKKPLCTLNDIKCLIFVSTKKNRTIARTIFTFIETNNTYIC